MGLDRRVIVALAAIALVLAPAAALRALCVGHSCDEPDENGTNIPFCSLPEARRDMIVAGFREGRSPDVLVVARGEVSDRVPMIFSGTGIDATASIPSGTTLDAIAPTVAEAIGLKRPHPEVRSGSAIDGVTDGLRPRIVVLIALPGIDSDDLRYDEWRGLETIAERGIISNEAALGSRPQDRAAALTTLGTGGLPYQHGITGTFVRNDAGKLVRAWGQGAPVSVIATLADDLDELHNQEPRIGLVATSASDQGLIGGNWYVDNDKDEVVIERSTTRAASAAGALLKEGFGEDDVTDLLALSLTGSASETDRAIASVTKAARAAATGEALIVIAGTGPNAREAGDIVEQIEHSIPGPRRLIERAVAGGFFVDQEGLAATGTTEDEVIEAIRGTDRFADVFPAITVTFARYC